MKRIQPAVSVAEDVFHPRDAAVHVRGQGGCQHCGAAYLKDLFGEGGAFYATHSGGMSPVYEGNPKHKAPWQPRRKGSLCPSDIGLEAARKLLLSSIVEGKRRYAIDNGRAFCAQQHDAAKNRWHGYPVGWREVPASVRRQFMESGAIAARDVKRHWEAVR